VPADRSSDQLPADQLPEQLRIRREKRAALLAAGTEPYPVTVPRTHTLSRVRREYEGIPTDTSTGEFASVTGRVSFARNGGKLCFATLTDGDGANLQVMLSLDRVGADRLADWKAWIDLGDFVSVTGEVISSRRGELSVLADSWVLAAKALRPPPNPHAPLSEESRARRRYADLLVSERARELARMRPRAVAAIRRFFDDRDFVEVETPALQTLQGGATARPYLTHSNALDIPLFLRIALELHLKRAVVGGIERVFEVGRVFRNEGVDATHSPEFTMLEAYEAWGDYDTMATLTRDLVTTVARAATGGTVLHIGEHEVDLAGDWHDVTLFGALSAAAGEVVDAGTPRADLDRLAATHGIELDPAWDDGKVALELFEHLCEPQLVEPTFVRDYPLTTRPLTRQHRADPRLTESWDLYVGGVELATAYSELGDPVVQRGRLVTQAKLAAGGDVEAMALDEDFVEALEYGFPPTGGLGMGVDRLVSFLAGGPLRDIILFPLVKPAG
jgi:lysyl-tRNA synthetase class 2